jgi:type I restriction enzyme M protein
MDNATHNTLVNFIWNIADDVLRDVYVRGKYRDVILPMTVLRRLDSLLVPTKDTVLERHQWLNDNKIFQQAPALQKASGYPFYNTSKFTLEKLLDQPTQIRENFEVYLDGFSANVQEIIQKFKLRNQIETLQDADRIFLLIEKFTAKTIHLGPEPLKTPEGVVLHAGLSNLGMGYVFEELIRRFNEDNNEEAGEHFTPREIIELMGQLIFHPIEGQIQSTTYLVYDPACGSGGMLTEAERVLQELSEKSGKKVRLELYGQEVNPETFAICQSDMLIKERDPGNIKYGSTISQDGHPATRFDFMLSNPPYGKSWSGDEKGIRDSKKEITDDRFKVGVPRTSDGQLLFLLNMIAKMKHDTPLGSRIATVHNGSALFTGDAGGGESEIRRHIIENDYLECIIGLPENMFYNTGISTYIWVLTNRKAAHRKGKVQLIDSSAWFAKLRKNLGKKNCEFRAEHIAQIMASYERFENTEHSRLFANEDFGYRKITVERPLRLRVSWNAETLALGWMKDWASALTSLFGKEGNLPDFNLFQKKWEGYLKANKVKWPAKEAKVFYDTLTERDPEATIVRDKDGNPVPDVDLRDTESVPLAEEPAVFLTREVLPYVPDAWIDPEKTTVGYEISFTKVFYKYQPPRPLEEILKDIAALEKETDGLLHAIAEDSV